MSTQTTDIADLAKADAYFCEMPSDPCAIVMFGASGDLAKRKLLPALFDLAAHACLAPRFRLLGFARTQISDEKFRSTTEESLPKSSGPCADESKRKEFVQQLHYFTGNYDEAESYRRL